VIEIREAERRLHEMLRTAGIEPGQPVFRATWAVFREFSNEPVRTPSDGVLVEGGIYLLRYCFALVRQFEVRSGDGEFDHYEQLQISFEYQPTSELRSLGAFSAWWFADDGTAIDDFLDEIETRSEFLAVADRLPTRMTVGHEEV